MPQTTDDKKLCQEALDAIEFYGSAAKAAVAMEISDRTVRDRAFRGVNRFGLKPQKSAKKPTAKVKVREAEPAVLLAADRRVRSAGNEVKDLEKLLKASEKENEEKQARLDLLLDVDDLQEKRRKLVIPNYTSKDGKGIFCALASDWHIEEDVSPESIPGYDNEYNPQIAEARAKKYFQSFIFMLEAWRHVGACDTALLAILGDIITGYIHEELMESNHLSPSRAVLFAQELLGAGIEYILSKGKLKKLIIATCYGNHGRTTPKSRIHTGADNSFEFLLYKTMQREWKAETRIDWHIAEGYHLNLDLFSTRLRLHHGDAIGYGGGIGGITIPVRKKIAGWNSGTSRPAHVDAFGHFHRAMDGGDFVVNGSLIGFNSFAQHIAAGFEPPQQVCFWIDSERGKTMSGRLFVE